MATKFHADIVGKPFFNSVQKELNRRKTLNQSSIETNATYELPFFSISRLDFLDDSNSYNEDNLKKITGKFASLGVIKDESYDITFGADSIIRNQTNQFTAPAGIESVTIEQKDYTFYTIDVNFVIPNIDDFEEFKKMWFHFGIPVEIDFGRRKVVTTPISGGDASPYRQKMSGVLVKFSYSSQGNRNITGNFKIYSMNFLLLQQEASNNEFAQKRMYSSFQDYIQRVVDFEDRKRTEENIKINNRRLYGIVKDITKIKKVSKDGFSTGGGGTFQTPTETNTFGNISFITEYPYPLGVEGLTETTFEKITQLDVPTNNEKSYYQDKQLELNKLTGNNEPLSVFITERSDITEVKGVLYYKRENSILSRFAGRRNFNKIKEIERKKRNNKRRDDILKNLKITINNNRNIIKELLAHLSIEEEKWNTDAYFYISMGAIQDFCNSFIKVMTFIDTANLTTEENSIKRIDFSETKIQDFEKKFGIISSRPEKIIYGNLHTDRDETSLEQSDKILLTDVFISIELLDTIAKDSKSIFSFIENIIGEINLNSHGIINLVKSNMSDMADNGLTRMDTITYVDNNSFEISENSQDFYTFDLYNPSEKIKNVSIQTSISENIEQYAFFNSRASISTENTATISDTRTTQDSGVSLSNIRPYTEETNLINFSDAVGQTITNMTNKAKETEHILMEFKLYRQFLQTQDVKNIKSYIRGDTDEIQSQNLLKFYAYLNRFVELQRQILFMEDSSVFGTEIPLQVSFDVDGISGLIPMQCFRISNRSFPIGYSLDEMSAYSFFVINGLTHDFQQNKWDTKLSGLLFLTQNGKRRLISQVTRGEVDEVLTKLRQRLYKLNDILIEEINRQE
jgi:hypothetical protein